MQLRRGRRRRRRHLVLEPLPRLPLRLRELHLRLPLLRGAVRRVGVAGALRRRSPRPSATSTTWSTGSTSAATCASALRVTSAVCDEASGTWAVTPRRRHARVRARFLVAATGVLSVPYIPDVPGPRRLPRRAAPHRPLARPSRSTSPASGSPSSAPRRAACRCVADRRSTRSPSSSSSSAPPTGAPRSTTRPITAEEQARAPGRLRGAARGAQHLAQRLPPPGERAARLRRLRRGAPGVLREDVEQPGLHEAHQQLHRHAVQRGGQRRVVRVHRRQDPRHRRTTRRPPRS